MGFVSDLFSRKNGAGFQAGDQPLMASTNENRNNFLWDQNKAQVLQNQDFVNALSAQGGIQNQSNIFGQQQAFANQLQDQANGNGPNPALAQLANTTGQNVSQQAALMGSQRGAGANAGLIARQAAMQGAGIQQQSAGQAAVLRAQQQIAAQQALQQQQAMMGQMSTQQVAQQQAARNAANSYAGGLYNSDLNAIGQWNNALVSMKSNQNNANADIANTNAMGQQQMFGGFMSGLSGAGATSSMPSMGSMGGGSGGGGEAAGGAAAAAYRGGMVSKGYADGGEVSDDFNIGSQFNKGPTYSLMGQPQTSNYSLGLEGDTSFSEPQSFAAKMLAQLDNSQKKPQEQLASIPQGMNPGAAAMRKGGYDQGKAIRTLATMGFGASDGGKVPGKPQMGGNDPKNDTVPAMLSPGEIVIPKSITESANAPDKAKLFVEAVLKKHGMRK